MFWVIVYEKQIQKLTKIVQAVQHQKAFTTQQISISMKTC